MRAYKFTLPGAVGPITGFEWPPPGEWVHAGGIDPCERGVHACRTDQLAYWLAAELWEVELAGEVVVDPRKVVGTSGRLRRRVDEWNASAQHEFAAWCAARTRAVAESTPSGPMAAYLDEYAADADAAAAAGSAVGAAQVAAVAAGDASVGRIAHDEASPGYVNERAEQARWLTARLQLADV